MQIANASFTKTVAKLSQSGWLLLIGAIALLIAAPVLIILRGVFVDAGQVWQDLVKTVLSTYITNSLWLMLGVGLGTALIGTGTA